MKKIFKTIDEQVNILIDKGLVIDNLDKAKEVLLRENYFFLSGYRHLFLQKSKSHLFIPGTNFRELYALFTFDRQLRNIIFKNILIIENNLKSIFSYQLSKNYGYREEDYLKYSNFNTSREKAKQVNDLLRKIKRQIRINGGQHSATTHYIYNYGYIPMWIVVKVLSFGIVCELFSIMKSDDQKDIAETLNISVNDLSEYLPFLANYRNLCAHEDILYDHRSASMISNTIYHENLGIEKIDGFYIFGKNDLFALILIMKKMLNEDAFRLLMKEIDYEINILSGILDTIKIDAVLKKMGFPKNYLELINM